MTLSLTERLVRLNSMVIGYLMSIGFRFVCLGVSLDCLFGVVWVFLWTVFLRWIGALRSYANSSITIIASHNYYKLGDLS